MHPFLVAIQIALLQLMPQASTDAERESLQILHNAAKAAQAKVATVLKAFQSITADPFGENVLPNAIAIIFPDGVPDDMKPAPVVNAHPVEGSDAATPESEPAAV